MQSNHEPSCFPLEPIAGQYGRIRRTRRTVVSTRPAFSCSGLHKILKGGKKPQKYPKPKIVLSRHFGLWVANKVSRTWIYKWKAKHRGNAARVSGEIPIIRTKPKSGGEDKFGTFLFLEYFDPEFLLARPEEDRGDLGLIVQ